MPTPKPMASVKWTDSRTMVNAIEAVSGTVVGVGYESVGDKLSDVTGQTPTIKIFPETYINGEVA